MPQGPFAFSCQGVDEAFLSQPMLQYLQHHLHAFNNKDWEALAAFHRPDVLYTRPNGQVTKGVSALRSAVREDHALFEDHFHEVSVCASSGDYFLFLVSFYCVVNKALFALQDTRKYPAWRP